MLRLQTIYTVVGEGRRRPAGLKGVGRAGTCRSRYCVNIVNHVNYHYSFGTFVGDCSWVIIAQSGLKLLLEVHLSIEHSSDVLFRKVLRTQIIKLLYAY